MNKIFLTFFLCTNIFASTPFAGDFSVSLKYNTKTKFKEHFTLVRKNKKIVLNGLILPSEKILYAKKNISFLVMNEKKVEPKLKCYKGNYTFTVVKKKVEKVERGCLGTERFGKLITAFKSI